MKIQYRKTDWTLERCSPSKFFTGVTINASNKPEDATWLDQKYAALQASAQEDGDTADFFTLNKVPFDPSARKIYNNYRLYSAVVTPKKNDKALVHDIISAAIALSHELHVPVTIKFPVKDYTVVNTNDPIGCMASSFVCENFVCRPDYNPAKDLTLGDLKKPSPAPT